MLVQHLRHQLERIDVRPGFWGLEWSCPSPWEVPEGMKLISTYKNGLLKHWHHLI